MHAGTHIDQSIRSFDQRSQDIRRQYVDGEDVRHAGRHVSSSRFAITDPCVVDDGVEAAEAVDTVRYGLCAADGGEIARDGILGAWRCCTRVAAALVISSVQNDLMAVRYKELGRHQSKAVRRSRNENPCHPVPPLTTRLQPPGPRAKTRTGLPQNSFLFRS